MLQSIHVYTLTYLYILFFHWNALFFLNSQLVDGEKKAKKRPFEEINVKDDDFASQSSPANPPQVLCVKTSCGATVA